MPSRTGGVGGVEDRAGTGEVDAELFEARSGDDLEQVETGRDLPIVRSKAGCAARPR